MTNYIFSKNITSETGINYKHIWRHVRRAGIEPQKINGVLCITSAEFEQFKAHLAADGFVAPKPTPAVKKQAKPATPATARKGIRLNDDKPSVPAEQLERNRRKIAKIQQAGKRPLVVGTGGKCGEVKNFKVNRLSMRNIICYNACYE